MRIEIHACSPKKAQNNVEKKDSLSDLITMATNGYMIDVEGVVKILHKEKVVKIFTRYTLKKEKIKAIFIEGHKNTPIYDRSASSFEVSKDDLLKLFVTAKDRSSKLKNILLQANKEDVTINGPAQRMDRNEYERMSSEAKKNYVSPFRE